MAGIWDFLNPNKKKKPTDQVNALEAVVAPKPQNFLSQFLPEDPNKREALSKALIMGGASAMAAGGPSDKPMNLLSVLGSGLAGAVGGYDESLQNSADSAYKNAAVSANALKMKQSALGTNLQEEFFRKWGPPGPAGYPPEALYDLQKMQLATGDEESARATQKQIQELQQTGAQKGFIIGEEGFQLAPGFGEGLFETKKFESLGSAVGQNAQITADQKNFQYGNENPAFRTYEEQQAKNKGTNVTVSTSPKDGEIFKAMQEERTAAQAAASGIRSIHEARHALNSGAVTGAFADTLLGMRKAAAVFGVGDTDAITNTETFRAAIAPQVAATLKSTVGTANISNTDREFAEKAAGGSIELDATSINRLLDIMERAQTATINQFNTRIEQLYPETDDGKNKTSRDFFGGVAVPENPYKQKANGNASSAEPAANGAVRITSIDQYNALPRGAQYIDPRDGSIKRKR